MLNCGEEIRTSRNKSNDTLTEYLRKRPAYLHQTGFWRFGSSGSHNWWSRLYQYLLMGLKEFGKYLKGMIGSIIKG